MIFPTASSTRRPVRLGKATRAWAWQALHGCYGDEALAHNSVLLDTLPDFEQLSPVAQYDAAVKQIAALAPLRFCPAERLCGSATLGLAISHVVPATYQGKPVFSSVSHLTLNYEKVLKQGLNAYRAEIEARLQDAALDAAQQEFLHSLLHTLEAFAVWHGRYTQAAQTENPEVYHLLQQVPFGPARNFHEAVQALWMVFAFVRLCGNWPGIGCIDRLLGSYLKQELTAGTLTREEAREILASFFIKGCEWICSNPTPCSGDAQHYQNIVLAGVDKNGKETANEVTYLVLDLVEELGISDFPITVRLNSKSPEKLLNKVARVMRHGGGVVAVYNEELILRALQNEGYPLDEACTFANDGCWEVQIPGKTDFGYIPFDALQIFNEVLGLNAEAESPDFQNAEELYQAFCRCLKEKIQAIYDAVITQVYQQKGNRWERRAPAFPTSVVSLFEEGCIENAASYFDFGPRYTVRSPHIGGAPDVANSLHAIQKLVFEEKKIGFQALVGLLRANWAQAEPLRQYVKNSYTYYGNDAQEPDAWAARLLDDFADLVKQCEQENRQLHGDCPVKFIPGVSTFGRQIEWAPSRSATAFGSKKGEILSGNTSPTPGTDSVGVTAIIRSYCKARLEKQSCGAALDLKIFPGTLRGQPGLDALKGLMKAFVRLNGFFFQLDTLDPATLRAAQENPENYKTLSVRVSGWNARFVTLEKEWQTMVIERTEQNL